MHAGFLTIAGAAIMLSGCALVGVDTGVQTVAVHNHHFDPEKIEVAASKPFTLVVDAIDEHQAVTISSPGLGIDKRMILANSKPAPMAAAPGSLNPAKRLKIPVGPLAPGTYQVDCNCHGEVSTMTVVATAIPGTRTALNNVPATREE
jgi:hypothetical protein